jgi:transposase
MLNIPIENWDIFLLAKSILGHQCRIYIVYKLYNSEGLIMINEKNFTQQKLEMVYLEDLAPKDHILRNIDKYMDLSFIRELTQKYYCLDNGRPGVDPILFFKMLFISYLFGIKCKQQLVKEVEVNVAYRWFLGLSLTDTIPNHSTISQNRRRRFKGIDVFQKKFDEVVLKP